MIRLLKSRVRLDPARSLFVASFGRSDRRFTFFTLLWNDRTVHGSALYLDGSTLLFDDLHFVRRSDSLLWLTKLFTL